MSAEQKETTAERVKRLHGEEMARQDIELQELAQKTREAELQRQAAIRARSTP